MVGIEGTDERTRNRVKESLSNKINKLPSTLLYAKSCIYKVPSKLRNANEEAYTPRLVSIGRYHHGRAHLDSMEQFKVQYLRNYLERCSFIRGNKFNLENAADWAQNMERGFKMYYQEISDTFSREELAEMILLDGVFIVEIFLKNYFPGLRRLRDKIDLIFETGWMITDLLHDMMLLENQLPYHIPFMLFENIKASLPPEVHFLDLTSKFFNVTDGIPLLKEVAPLHLLDYLLNVHLGGLYPFAVVTRRHLECPYTATILREAGVKFSPKKSRFIDIEFHGGVLTIPTITITDWTETFFRNLIAYEQCHHRPGYVSSYVIFLDSLINNSKDVDILVQCGIMINALGDSEQVADLFNNITREVITEDSDFHFCDISMKLNDYRKDYWHTWKSAWYKWKAARYTWKVILGRDYFGNPWSTISVIAAIFLLALTVVQTVCSILQVTQA